jgi:hypothetical protein
MEELGFAEWPFFMPDLIRQLPASAQVISALVHASGQADRRLLLACPLNLRVAQVRGSGSRSQRPGCHFDKRETGQTGDWNWSRARRG